jgi:hypothetical protein
MARLAVLPAWDRLRRNTSTLRFPKGTTDAEMQSMCLTVAQRYREILQAMNAAVGAPALASRIFNYYPKEQLAAARQGLPELFLTMFPTTKVEAPVYLTLPE